MKVGSGRFNYELAQGWGGFPEGWQRREVPGVAVDSHDRVFLFVRGPNPVNIFDRDGKFIKTWGQGVFGRPHGICIGPDDSVYCVDDGDHTVRKFTSDGKLLLTLGAQGQPSDTGGYDGHDYRKITRGGPPFNRPTNLALSPSGEMYVTDGYGNCRVHKFAADGQLVFSWGDPGTGPGEFGIPHGIAVDKRGTVYVGDRQNNRIPVFTPDGKFVTQWTGINRPDDLFLDAEENLFVAELGHRVGISQGMPTPSAASPWSTVAVLDLKGNVLARWGGEDGHAPGNFWGAHGIWADSHGDLYVSEVATSSGKSVAPSERPLFQKFVRVAAGG